VRSLPTVGTQQELASRLAHHDLRVYPFPSTLAPCNSDASDARPADPHPCPTPDVTSVPPQSKTPLSQSNGTSSPKPSDTTGPIKSKLSMQNLRIPRSRASYISPLPVEIMAEIMDQVGDWELTKAVGLPTSLSQPSLWTRASPTDHALLTGFLPLLVSCEPSLRPPTSIGARLIVRFSYIHILAYFHRHCRARFGDIFRNHLIPITAAHHGRVAVLDWWQSMRKVHPEDFPIPDSRAIIDAIDGASRAGQVDSLDWWLKSGLPFEYTEAALEHASAKNRPAVLEWWREQRTRLRSRSAASWTPRVQPVTSLRLRGGPILASTIRTIDRRCTTRAAMATSTCCSGGWTAGCSCFTTRTCWSVRRGTTGQRCFSGGTKAGCRYSTACATSRKLWKTLLEEESELGSGGRGRGSISILMIKNGRSCRI
jgi:hypothetical protein